MRGFLFPHDRVLCCYMKNGETPKFVRWAIVASIAILLAIFTVVTVEYFFPSPEYNSFFPEDRVALQDTLTTKESCVAANGVWKPYIQRAPVSAGSVQQNGFCDLFSKADDAYQAAQKEHAQTAFVAFLLVGLTSLIGGVFLKGSSIVSAGLSYGGVLVLIIGGIRFLGELDRIFQVVSIGGALLALLIIAYWKFRDEKL